MRRNPYSETATHSSVDWLAALLTSALLASAWLMPLTVAGAALAFLAVIGLIKLSEARSFLPSYCCAVVTYLIAFHWLSPTLGKFSGLPAIASGFFFFLFCAVSALQFPLYRFFANSLRRIGLSLLAPAIGWVAAQEIFFRIFPWTPAHSLIATPPLSQLAYLTGANGITLLMFVVGSLIIKRSRRGLNIVLAFGIIALVSWFGINRLSAQQSKNEIYVAVIQGNISVEQKHSRQMLQENVNQYFRAGMKASEDPRVDVVIWPESVILSPISITTKALPELALPRAALLFGALSYGPNDQFFNSAWGISPRDGMAAQPYHKQILMPFGEYTPGIEIFPFLKDINQNAAEFTPGSAQTLIPIATAHGEVKLAPLICYEDVIPGPAETAAAQGANILVNMSNDAWFGVSVAAKQHHQIAAWRAIETGLPLIRATNTGFSAIVSHLGETVADLSEHESGSLVSPVNFGTGPARYGAKLADDVWRILSYLVTLLAIFSLVVSARRH